MRVPSPQWTTQPSQIAGENKGSAQSGDGCGEMTKAVREPTDMRAADLEPLLVQFSGQCAGALAGPAKRRHRIIPVE